MVGVLFMFDVWVVLFGCVCLGCVVWLCLGVYVMFRLGLGLLFVGLLFEVGWVVLLVCCCLVCDGWLCLVFGLFGCLVFDFVWGLVWVCVGCLGCLVFEVRGLGLVVFGGSGVWGGGVWS